MTQLDKVFALHEKALGVRTQRAQVLASNIANADTPGYHARDVDFRAALDASIATRGASGQVPASRMVRTSAGHLAGQADALTGTGPLVYRAVSQASLDNNSVDVNVERAQFADNALRYEASLVFVNSRIKGLLAAIQN